MSKKVAFLRGINVGGRTIRMAELKECLEKAGFKEVNTLLQSGNVTLESDSDLASLRSRLETAVSKQFHYDAKIFVHRIETVRKIIENYPFNTEDKTKQYYVVFTEPGLPQELASAATDEDIEKVAAGDSVIYWTVEKGQTLKSIFAKELNKSAYKGKFTSRNLNTLRKIA